MLNNIIVALDQMTDKEALKFIEENKDFKFYKVGLELYLRYGRNFLNEITKISDAEIFLDLKLHDIPRTVAKSIESLASLPLAFLTLHSTGGIEMMKLAEKYKREFLPETKLLGVSILTSLDHLDAKELFGLDNFDITRLVRTMELAEIGGMVCSGQDLDQFQTNLIKVCPGIRFEDEISHDQKRVLTPKEAFLKGADYLVMGRSLTQAKDLKLRIQQLSDI